MDVFLDWHEDGWRFRPAGRLCAICGNLCHLVNDDGTPVHKTCLQDQLADLMEPEPAAAETP